MEKPKKVNWSATALLMIADTYDYLVEQTGEYFADKFTQELLEFGERLSIKSEQFSYCRNPKLQAKGYRSALFRKKYMVIYQTSETQVDILGVVHSRRNPKDYENL
ncbi:MAG TPA: type II toxin-antitoxin system RelE/ParE family toxin [Saprospiraceae bacterium]|nr:type II toxin-antitoxin system RelE/ParE family toxin [Saprospiraceae bacterium]